ncbi:Uncharacterised protein [Nocardia otitidiscaviarum]|uniref:Peptidase S1 domain-containing protein n=1 Tax=Nocardia otitidiscaviarum TaxID=1823 RepID=A0A379JGX0_9NOCA|nr:hypothetical protein [Nocardia otitidiscaviarum]SUD47889.1 Uncharacterised protein [Nocardia otitidiscaviarum]
MAASSTAFFRIFAGAAMAAGSEVIVGSKTCTLTMIGYDRYESVVGVTAGHCAETGHQIRLRTRSETTVVGEVVRPDHILDYVVLAFGPAVAPPTGRPQEIGAESAPGETVCKPSASSGLDRGLVWGRYMGTAMILNQTCSLSSDSVAPVFHGSRLVGMNSRNLSFALGSMPFDESCSAPTDSHHNRA